VRRGGRAGLGGGTRVPPEVCNWVLVFVIWVGLVGKDQPDFTSFS